jgi:hypothetical protein
VSPELDRFGYVILPGDSQPELVQQRERDLAAGVPPGDECRAIGCIGYKPGQRCCESDGFGVGFVTGTDGEIAEARGLPTY